jgi:hypothetical protein
LSPDVPQLTVRDILTPLRPSLRDRTVPVFLRRLFDEPLTVEESLRMEHHPLQV